MPRAKVANKEAVKPGEVKIKRSKPKEVKYYKRDSFDPEEADVAVERVLMAEKGIEPPFGMQANGFKSGRTKAENMQILEKKRRYWNVPKGIPIPSYLRSKTIMKHWLENGQGSLQDSINALGHKIDASALKATKSFKLVAEEFFPDDYLAAKHRELLEKRAYREVRTIKKPTGDTEKVYEDMGPETAAVSKGLELAYKVKGAFSKEEKEDGGKVNTSIYNLFYKPEIRDQVKSFEQKLKEQIIYDATKNTGVAKHLDTYNADGDDDEESEDTGDGKGDYDETVGTDDADGAGGGSEQR